MMCARSLLRFAVLLGIQACSSETPATQHVQLASLGFDVPVGWQRTDTQRHGIVTAEWRPEDNDGKESLLVIRTEMAAIPQDTTGSTFDDALAEVQKGLGDARVGTPSHVRTRGGFDGVSIETDFEPAGVDGRYHREHVVLVEPDGSSLIHVLYTARTPDSERRSLRGLLDSIRHEEG